MRHASVRCARCEPNDCVAFVIEASQAFAVRSAPYAHRSEKEAAQGELALYQEELELQIHPLTVERWKDLENLLGPRGACGGCWCMWLRLPHSEFAKRKGDGNRRAFKARVETGATPPGLLAYDGDEPIGWCAVAPRDEFPKLDRSRVLARIDERPVWSIVCFFVRKSHRRMGVTKALIDAAIRLAQRHGADLLEAYPIEPKKTVVPPVFAWNGLVSAFLGAGFEEVARRSATRPTMRRSVAARPCRGPAEKGERP